MNLRKLLTFIYRQKNNFILNVFLEILQTYCLGTLGMPGYTNPYYQPVENFCVCLQAKNQVHPIYLFGDIAQICKHPTLDTLGMAGYTHPK